MSRCGKGLMDSLSHVILTAKKMPLTMENVTKTCVDKRVIEIRNRLSDM